MVSTGCRPGQKYRYFPPLNKTNHNNLFRYIFIRLCVNWNLLRNFAAEKGSWKAEYNKRDYSLI